MKNMPTSSVIDFHMRVLTKGQKITKLEPTKKGGDSAIVNSSLKVINNFDENSQMEIELKTKSSKLNMHITDIEKISGTNVGIKKLFIFCLMKLFEEKVYEKENQKDASISFPISDLISAGIYSCRESAKVGILAAQQALASMLISGKVLYKGEYTNVIKKGYMSATLFPYIFVNEDMCTIDINYRVNWLPVLAYYTILPDFAFTLNGKAFDLMYHIFYLARQNTEVIQKDGYFDIRLRTVQTRLGLPDEAETANPRKTIKGEIKKIVKVINEIAGEDTGIKLEIIAKKDRKVSDFLNTGILRVHLQNRCVANFLKIKYLRQGGSDDSLD